MYVEALVYYDENIDRSRCMLDDDAVRSCAATKKTTFHINYDPLAQSGSSMNYFRPEGNLFVGDCIPFYHGSAFYLYWLPDSGHHSALNGMGGHQWVLSTSRDLKNRKHYPVVLGIDEDWEKSICTGSVVHYNDTFYAFYATRLIDPSGEWREYSG